jgi:serine/threonine protein kinase
MVDVYRRQPIDEKSDIWALGVFLYKLCYYTTPFEDKGTLAILNATFTFPALPSYSTKIKNLIGKDFVNYTNFQLGHYVRIRMIDQIYTKSSKRCAYYEAQKCR